MDSPKYIVYDGLKFCRDEKTGYYLNSTIRKRLHRYVWEKEVGAIPKGCHIHHINGDKADNRIDNLSLMTAKGHERLHGQVEANKELHRRLIENARPAAIAWHKSEAGRKWHAQQATGRTPPRYEKVCSVCGKTFMGIRKQKFCSNACRAKYRRDTGADDEERICQQCGKPFKCSRFEANKFCSVECRAKAHQGWYQRKTGKETG